MKTFRTEILINAPAPVVWRVLTDKGMLLSGDFAITRIEGEIAENAPIKLWSEAAPDRAFALKVVEFDAPRRMVWQGGMPLGLFTGTRQFSVTTAGAGTEFAMQEDFTGLMSGLITKSMPDLQPFFDRFSAALKHKAEDIA